MKRLPFDKPDKMTYTKARAYCKKWFNKYIVLTRKGCEVHDEARRRGIVLPFKCGGAMQCCHIIPVSQSRATQFMPENVYRGCGGGNMWEKANRNTWFELWPKIWPDRVRILNLVKSMRVKHHTNKLLLTGKWYENEVKRLMKEKP